MRRYTLLMSSQIFMLVFILGQLPAQAQQVTQSEEHPRWLYLDFPNSVELGLPKEENAPQGAWKKVEFGQKFLSVLLSKMLPEMGSLAEMRKAAIEAIWENRSTMGVPSLEPYPFKSSDEERRSFTALDSFVDKCAHGACRKKNVFVRYHPGSVSLGFYLPPREEKTETLETLLMAIFKKDEAKFLREFDIEDNEVLRTIFLLWLDMLLEEMRIEYKGKTVPSPYEQKLIPFRFKPAPLRILEVQ